MGDSLKPHSVNHVAPLWSDAGSAFVHQHGGRWTPIVIEERGHQHTLRSCATEGEAVDALHKWSTDRGLSLVTGMFVLRKVHHDG